MIKNDLATPIGVVETLDISTPEHQRETDKLERAVLELIAWLEGKASEKQKKMFASSDIFSMLIGLAPEVFIHLPDQLIYETLQNPWFKDKYLFLKIKTHKDSYSIINIEAAKSVIQKNRETVPGFGKMRLDSNKETFEDELIQVFENASTYQKELMYGLLSGFPLSAAISWCESMEGDNLAFNFSRFNPAELPSASEYEFIDSYVESLHQPPYFEHRPYSPKKKDKLGHRTLPPLATYGLPGMGFRFAENTLDDPEMQLLYARYNFVYRTLGVADYLRELVSQKEAVEPPLTQFVQNFVHLMKKKLQAQK